MTTPESTSVPTGLSGCVCSVCVLMVLMVFLPRSVRAQDAPLPVAVDTLRVVGPGPFILRPFVVRESLRLRVGGRELQMDAYELDHATGLFSVRGVPADSAYVLVATYRYIPLRAVSGRRLWSFRDRNADTPARTARPTVSSSRLERSGSVTRGVLTGTGRDAAIESALRLQIQGEIAPGLRVVAALTDEDTPILPQGTTRRLDQFDRVYIRLETDRGHLELGDVDLNHRGGRYDGVRRSLQGAVLQAGSLTSAGATSRGQFRSQRIVPVDGVQGPYRLEGASGERFLLLVPGSERVYLDGILLSRGLSEDYSVDYTTAEITFTSRHIMGPERRVRVEFEYTTNQFTRTFLMGSGMYAAGKSRKWVSVAVTAIRESDGQAFTEELAFTAADSAAVAAAGDTTPVRSGAEAVPYDPESLFTQYFADTMPDGSVIYRAVDRPPVAGETVYRVTFSRVRDRNGAYTRSGLQGNGIVFLHVGAGNGAYDPVVPLRAPSRQELLDVRVDLAPVSGVHLDVEWAGSRLDRNLLSGLDAADNDGQAFAVGLRTRRLFVGERAVWIQGSGRHSTRTANFTAFERVRDVEFERRWNLTSHASQDVTTSIVSGTGEDMTDASLTIGALDSTRLTLSVSQLSLGSSFDGQSGEASFLSAEPGRPVVTARTEWVRTEDRLGSPDRMSAGTWSRHAARVEASERQRTRPFIGWQRDRLRTQDERAGISPEPDVDALEVGVGTSMGRMTLQSRLEWREETRWRQGPLPLDATVLTGQSTLQSDFDRGYARLDVGARRTKLATGTQDDALLIGAQADLRITRRLRANVLYDARSERSATLQEIYIRTGPERGQYVWDDFNGDGVIQLDEFVPETNPTEGTYVRTLLPGDSLQAVTHVSARLRFDVAPGRTGGWRAVGLSTVVEVQETSRSSDRADIYLLRSRALRSPGETIQGRLRVAQTARLLPLARQVDLDVSVQTVRSLSGLAAGDEEGRADVADVTGRWRATTRVEWGARVGRERDASTSTSFSSRSYDIRSWRMEPSLRVRASERIGLVLAPAVAFKSEQASDARARVILLPVEGTWAVRERLRSSIRLEHARVKLDEDRVGLAAFELTDGRGRGASWLWRVGLQAEFSERLSARFSYDGRAPSGSRTVHTGRVQFTALF